MRGLNSEVFGCGKCPRAQLEALPRILQIVAMAIAEAPETVMLGGRRGEAREEEMAVESWSRGWLLHSVTKPWPWHGEAQCRFSHAIVTSAHLLLGESTFGPTEPSPCHWGAPWLQAHA